jgi:hypothetical protein
MEAFFIVLFVAFLEEFINTVHLKHSEIWYTQLMLKSE